MAAVDVVAGDEGTAAAAARVLCSLWWSSGPSRLWRVPGEAGVRVRLFVGVRRAAGGSSAPWPGCRGAGSGRPVRGGLSGCGRGTAGVCCCSRFPLPAACRPRFVGRAPAGPGTTAAVGVVSGLARTLWARRGPVGRPRA
ncbi:DUF6207 family protein [Streptomyces sp. NPDC059788]|uniref:DUF6207 family protein n=1 Tax=Streptomyces sp. NPDC059788 TaxID=3346948 RepID=UPI003653CED2